MADSTFLDGYDAARAEIETRWPQWRSRARKHDGFLGKMRQMPETPERVEQARDHATLLRLALLDERIEELAIVFRAGAGRPVTPEELQKRHAALDAAVGAQVVGGA